MYRTLQQTPFIQLILGCILLAGCISARSNTQTTDRKNQQIELKISKLIDERNVLIDQTNALSASLNKRISDLESRISQLEAGNNIAHLTQSETKRKSQNHNKDIDRQRLIKLLEQDTDPSLIMASVAETEIQPYANLICLLLGEYKNISNYQMVIKLENLASLIPRKHLKPLLSKYLMDSHFQLNMIAIIGKTADQDLALLLSDPQIKVTAINRFELARSYILCKISKGIPLLLEILQTVDSNRLIAHHLLTQTTGQSFGYSPLQPIEQNTEALLKWNIWWKSVENTYEIK